MGQQPSKDQRDTWHSRGSSDLEVVEEALAGYRYDSKWEPSPPPPTSARRPESRIKFGRTGDAVPVKTTDAKRRKKKREQGSSRTRDTATRGSLSSATKTGNKSVRYPTAPRSARTSSHHSYLPRIGTNSPILNPYSPELPDGGATMPGIDALLTVNDDEDDGRPPTPPEKPLFNSLGKPLCFELARAAPAREAVPIRITAATSPPAELPFARTPRLQDPAKARIQLPLDRSLGEAAPGGRVVSCPTGPSPSPIHPASRGPSPTPDDAEEYLRDRDPAPADILATSMRLMALASPRPSLPTFEARPSTDSGITIVKRARTPSPPPRLPVPRTPSPLVFDDDIVGILSSGGEVEPEQHEKKGSSTASSPQRRRPLPVTPALPPKAPIVVDALTTFKTWSKTTQMAGELSNTPSVFSSTIPSSGEEEKKAGTKQAFRLEALMPSKARSRPPAYEPDLGKGIVASKSSPADLGKALETSRSTSRSRATTLRSSADKASSSKIKKAHRPRSRPHTAATTTTAKLRSGDLADASSSCSSRPRARNPQTHGIRLVPAGPPKPRRQRDGFSSTKAKRSSSRVGRTKERVVKASSTPEIRVSFSTVADPVTGRLGAAQKRGFDGKEISSWLAEARLVQ